MSDTVDDLLRDHASIVRAVVQIHLPRMEERELSQILENAEKALRIKFTPGAASLIVRMSQGLPHYTHLIGLHATRGAANRLSRLIEIKDVHESFDKAITQALQSIQERYVRATESAHKDALHDKIILACAVASSTAKDALGYFRPTDVCKPLAVVLGRPIVKVATFQKHINDFCEIQRGPILERYGIARAYKYRFHDPLVPPYVFMAAMADGVIDSTQLTTLTSPS